MRLKKRTSSSSHGSGGVDRSHSLFQRFTAGSGVGGNDPFICFTSRPSTSSSAAAASMRGGPSSKSLLSPGRGRDQPMAAPSLSVSLSRRLRSSGSVKGAHSPMFPAVVAAAGGGRRKGSVLETTEPSSPKVTCIGQVRVKTKKRKKKIATAAARSRSRRGGSRGEASFRMSEEFGPGKDGFSHKNQRWAYQLPVSICEALKAIGSEFSCLFPCGGRSVCTNSSRSAYEPEVEQCCGREKLASSSCWTVIARWLRATQDGEVEGKREEMVSVVVERRRDREMEVLIKDMEKEEVELEKKDDVEVNGVKGEEKEVEEARVSICVPPPNALLLMRCRSDPVRMAALATRFWDSPAMKVLVEKEVVEEDQEEVKGSFIDDMLEEQVEGAVGAEDVVPSPGVVSETAEQVDQKGEDVEQSTRDVGLFDDMGSSMVEKEVKASEVGEKQQSLSEENQLEHLDLIYGTSASPETHPNHSLYQEDEEATAENGELEITETRRMENEAHLAEKEVEKEEEEIKGRRSNSYSSSVDKEVRKSSKCQPRANEGGKRRSSASRERGRRRHSFSTERDVRRPSFSNEREAKRASFSIEWKRRWSFCIEVEDLRLEMNALDDEKKKDRESSAEEELKETSEAKKSKTSEEEQTTVVQEEREAENAHVKDNQGEFKIAEEHKEEKRGNELPDCLLLMMNEPKLSMELSKETWVCSTDFLRWHPHHSQHSKLGGDEIAKMKAQANDKHNDRKEKEVANSLVIQGQKPPESEPSFSTAIEKKVMTNAAAVMTPALASTLALAPPVAVQPVATPYGPFVLTRCKSEPMRSSARLAPDACFWRDRHRPIGATGIGF